MFLPNQKTQTTVGGAWELGPGSWPEVLGRFCEAAWGYLTVLLAVVIEYTWMDGSIDSTDGWMHGWIDGSAYA